MPATTTATKRAPTRPAGLGGLAQRYFAHDVEGRAHALNVARLALRIAHCFSLPQEDLIAIAVGATMHDIGKLMVPATVLETPGELTRDEWALMRRHPAWGDALVSPHLRHPVVRSVIRSHHERVDGSGYPDGLGGADIPLAARIVAVADAYEAILANRPYSLPRPRAAALAEIVAGAGSQFDPDCARMLVELEHAERRQRRLERAGR